MDICNAVVFESKIRRQGSATEESDKWNVVDKYDGFLWRS